MMVAREKGFSLKDAVEHYATHLESLNHSASIETAIEEFLAIREAEGNAKAHLIDLRAPAQPVRSRVWNSPRCFHLDQGIGWLAAWTSGRAPNQGELRGRGIFVEGPITVPAAAAASASE